LTENGQVRSVEVFHHLEQPEEFMEAALRQLKRGARFIIVEPNINQSWGKFEKGCFSDPVKTRAPAEKVGFEYVREENMLIEDRAFYILLLRVP
jgi:2-polyprenyl-3-methyl-5-hydroxy-6-metoxy-1,4-benzoquinol methylase